jgi:RecB family endonuclease NucS
LLQTFGSVDRLVHASEAELHEQRGIGAKRAGEIHRVLHAEYRSVDTERNLEDAIEAAPELLFGANDARGQIELLARQHLVHSAQGERQIVDLVFVDRSAPALILVELKRGALRPEDESQLQRYLDGAHKSPLLRAVLDDGARLRGILATVEDSTENRSYCPQDERISTHIIDREATIEVLVTLRGQHRNTPLGT